MTKSLTATPSSKDFKTIRFNEPAMTQDIVLASVSEPVTVTGATIVPGAGDPDAFSVAAAEEGAYPLTPSLGKVWQNYDCDLPPRASFGFTKMGDYFYAVGGVNDTETLNDCWRSLDGIAWERMSAGCFGKPRSHFALFHNANDRLVACGGFVEGTATDEIWYSDNEGSNWTKSASTIIQPRARMGYCTAIHHGTGKTMMVMAGGVDNVLTYLDSVRVCANGDDTLDFSSSAGGCAFGGRADCLLLNSYPTGGTASYFMLYGGDDGVTPLLNDGWEAAYDVLGTWTEQAGAPFSSARCGVAGIAGQYGGVGLIVLHGGLNDLSGEPYLKTSGALRYSINRGVSWSTLATTYYRRAYHAVGTIETTEIKLIMMAGLGSSNPPS